MGALKTDQAMPLFLSMSFLSPMLVLTTQSTDLWLCLQKVFIIPCPSGANIALKVGGEGLGGCFLSGVVEGVVAIELHLELLF